MVEATNLTTAGSGSDPLAEPDRRSLVYGACGFIVLAFGVYFPILRNMVHHWRIVEDSGAPDAVQNRCLRCIRLFGLVPRGPTP